MKRCPNCGRETVRTLDWACQWCGYPLLVPGYKKIEKTFRELQEERGFLPPSSPAEPPELETDVAPEPEIEPEPEVRRVVKPELRGQAPRPELEITAKPELEIEPEPEAEPEPVRLPESFTAPEPVTPPSPQAGEEPAPELEPAAPIAPETGEAAEPVTPSPAVPEAIAPAEQAAPPKPAPPALSLNQVNMAAELIELHVRDLNAMFQQDKAAAGAALTGKRLRISGTVDRAVASGHLEIYYVLLTSDDPKSWNVRCVFNPDQSKDIQRLVKGHQVTVEGKYSGFERNILLKDCSLVY